MMINMNDETICLVTNIKPCETDMKMENKHLFVSVGFITQGAHLDFVISSSDDSWPA